MAGSKRIDINSKKLKIVMAGGGTGGHLFPAIAIAEAFVEKHPENQILFVGTGKAFETTVLAEHGFRSSCITVEGIKGKGIRHQIRSLTRLPKGVMEAFAILSAFKPDIVVGVGSYASGPLALVAWLLRIPIVLHEQNILPGITNRVLFPLAKRVYVSFPKTRFKSRSSKICISGNPVRKEIREWAIHFQAAGNLTATDQRSITVGVMGGSQGAHSVNLAIKDALPMLKPFGYRFIHQTGEADLEMVREAYRRQEIPGIVQPFFQDMRRWYQQADLIICRSGATTVAEITAIGKPSILIPFPYASDNHQELNALSLVESMAAEMILENQLTGTLLAERIRWMAEHPRFMNQMAFRARQQGNPQAAEMIVNDCYSLLDGR